MALVARGAKGAAVAAISVALFGAGTAPFLRGEARADEAKAPTPGLVSAVTVTACVAAPSASGACAALSRRFAKT